MPRETHVFNRRFFLLSFCDLLFSVVNFGAVGKDVALDELSLEEEATGRQVGEGSGINTVHESDLGRPVTPLLVHPNRPGPRVERERESGGQEPANRAGVHALK